jgi:alkanesulfonate monooxygenase SsuD/methylene tetrahydromethanopterin reductase-like flavin-dependent oxidoreductase (luciferase family)
LHALGIGAGADRVVIDAVARSAEEHGFATLWAGEHVVMVDDPASTYPYTDDGRIAVPAVVDWTRPGYVAPGDARPDAGTERVTADAISG